MAAVAGAGLVAGLVFVGMVFKKSRDRPSAGGEEARKGEAGDAGDGLPRRGGGEVVGGRPRPPLWRRGRRRRLIGRAASVAGLGRMIRP